MEPLAPGTEDDPPISFSSLTKQQDEQERLLSIQAFLPNGKFGKVFELDYINGTEHWYCKACECPIMGRVYQHELGKRHNMNMTLMNRHKQRYEQQEETQEEEELPVEVAPGEPIPPGFEGDMERSAQIQERLDGFKVGPLIALEYLLELQDDDTSKEPLYLCILCDKKGDPRTVLTHLSSYNHLSQYLQKHFPTCYRALTPYMTKQYKRNWQMVLQKIAEAIEQKFGRLRPMPVDKDKFERDREPYLQIIGKGRHFSELSGYTFEELIVHDELTKVHDDDKGDGNFVPTPTIIAKPFQKRKSPSPPVVARPTKPVPKPTVNTGPQQKKQQRPAYKIVDPVAKKQAAQRKAQQQQQQMRVEHPSSRRSLSSVSSISSSSLSDFEGEAPNAARGGKNQRNRGVSYDKRPRGRSRSPFRKRSPSPRDQFGRSRGDRRGNQGYPPYQRSRPKDPASQRDEKENERQQKMEEYKKLSRAIENDVDRIYKQHEKNPEKHPQYNDEWKKFWNRRYKELQAEGKDAAKYDFKPEWIEFWNKRMRELHQEESDTKKEALKRRLGLVEEPTPVSFRLGSSKADAKTPPKRNSSPQRKRLPMAAEPDQDPEVILIEDREKQELKRSSKRSHSPWENDSLPRSRVSMERSREGRGRSREAVLKERERSKYGRRSRSNERNSPPPSKRSRSVDKRSRSKERYDTRERSRERERERPEKPRGYRESSFERDMRSKHRVRLVSDLPWEREGDYRPGPEYGPDKYYRPPHVMRDVTRHPVEPPPPVEEEDDEEINIVSILRLLTALEEKLGSLGPKVIDLLAQALALEKQEANSSEILLDNELNCVLFETVKEKLKGQLLAGLVDKIQERAFKNAIKKTASLIHMAGERKKEKQKTQPKVEPVKVPGVGAVDKAAIAKQIANALIAQGKTDVTQAELEQLINAVVGMAEASKNSDRPMTTANFLQQIAAGGIPKTSEEEGKEQKPPTPKKKIQIHSDIRLDKLTEPLTPSPDKSSTSNMDHLSDSDLQTLLQNFKDLSTDEQHGLINYLKKLEANEPDRVERLRKFVNLGGSGNSNDASSGPVIKKQPEVKIKSEVVVIEEGGDVEEVVPPQRVESPFSNRLGSLNPTVEEEKKAKEAAAVRGKLNLDSDDEDYTFEDVVKTVSKNVQDKEIEKERKVILDTQALISNLMSSFTKPAPVASPTVSKPLEISASTASLVASSADFTKTLNSLPINISSLADIVGSVQNLTKMNQPSSSIDINNQTSVTNTGPPKTTHEVTGSGIPLVKPGGVNIRMGGFRNDEGPSTGFEVPVVKPGGLSIRLNESSGPPKLPFSGPMGGNDFDIPVANPGAPVSIGLNESAMGPSGPAEFGGRMGPEGPNSIGPGGQMRPGGSYEGMDLDGPPRSMGLLGPGPMRLGGPMKLGGQMSGRNFGSDGPAPMEGPGRIGSGGSINPGGQMGSNNFGRDGPGPMGPGGLMKPGGLRGPNDFEFDGPNKFGADGPGSLGPRGPMNPGGQMGANDFGPDGPGGTMRPGGQTGPNDFGPNGPGGPMRPGGQMGPNDFRPDGPGGPMRTGGQMGPGGPRPMGPGGPRPMGPGGPMRSGGPMGPSEFGGRGRPDGPGGARPMGPGGQMGPRGPMGPGNQNFGPRPGGPLGQNRPSNNFGGNNFQNNFGPRGNVQYTNVRGPGPNRFGTPRFGRGGGNFNNNRW